MEEDEICSIHANVNGGFTDEGRSKIIDKGG